MNETLPPVSPGAAGLEGTDSRLSATGDSEDDVERLAANAMAALAGPSSCVRNAFETVPNRPGLYAIHAAAPTWNELGLDLHHGQPLYVGKAEASLRARDLRSHFGLGSNSSPTTGSSTLRRSLAALLREPLDLHAVPRNRAKPGHFSNFSLEPAAEARLTVWMAEHLTLAIWAKPEGSIVPLVQVERRVLASWGPPLNLTEVPRPRKSLREARARMAEEARALAEDLGFVDSIEVFSDGED